MIKLGIVRFMLDGENINPDTTPADMDCKFNIFACVNEIHLI